MKILSSLTVAVLLLFMAQTGLQAQPADNTTRNSSVAFRIAGGASMALGSSFDKLESVRAKEYQPLVAAGLMYNFSPLFRLGLDYSFTRMVREQTGTVVTQSDGSMEGDVYKDFKTLFHAASLTGEFNILGRKTASNGFGLYLGAGAGCLFGDGNIYTVGMKNELMQGKSGNVVHVVGHNEGHNYIVPFIPLSLSMEIAFLPNVAVTLGGGYRFILAGKSDFAPTGQPYATLGLCINLSK